jgi:hypothetical protein
MGQQDMKAFMARDGKKGPFYEKVMIPIYSPDSSRLSYIAKKEGKWIMVLDEKESKKYDSIAYPTVTPDSKHFVYLAMKDNIGWWLLTERKGGEICRVQGLEHNIYLRLNSMLWLCDRDRFPEGECQDRG